MSRVTLESLAEAAQVDVTVVKDGVRDIEQSLLERGIGHAARPQEKTQDLEMLELAAGLLGVGLKDRTVCQVLKDLHPELNRRHGRKIYGVVRRAAEAIPQAVN